MLSWRFSKFDDLSPREVHDIYRVRVEVFVLEQNCVFQDVDGADPACYHLIGTSGPKEILAYCRVVPPGVKYPEPSIGRIVTAPSARGAGHGRSLVKEGIARTRALWPDRAIRIGAQARLEKFYNEFGFVRASEEYDEDGIAHIEMLLAGDPT